MALRVSKGGHPVPDDTVQRRFVNGLTNFFTACQGAVDTWQLHYTADAPAPRLIAHRSAGHGPTIDDPAAWQRLKEYL